MDVIIYAVLLVAAGALLLAVDLRLDRLLAGKPWRLSLMWVVEAALIGFLWIAATAISGVNNAVMIAGGVLLGIWWFLACFIWGTRRYVDGVNTARAERRTREGLSGPLPTVPTRSFHWRWIVLDYVAFGAAVLCAVKMAGSLVWWWGLATSMGVGVFAAYRFFLSGKRAA